MRVAMFSAKNYERTLLDELNAGHGHELLSVMQILHDEFSDSKYHPCPLLKELVAVGHLGRQSGRGVYSYSCMDLTEFVLSMFLE